MNYAILAVLFILSGLLMKFSDDLFDTNDDLKFASIIGIFCALFSAMATLYSIEAAYIFIGILIGNLLALKIDGIHHWITLIVYTVICLIFGIPKLNIIILLLCIFSALADEVGHELISQVTENKFINLFFEYRFVMKVVILLLVVFGEFNILTFVCFLLFEISYEIAGITLEKLNNLDI